MKYSELIKSLKESGCQFVKHGKEHDTWYSPITDKKFRVARHKAEIPTGTCNRILKDAGLK